jgi:ABC-2 type transport system permease protein
MKSILALYTANAREFMRDRMAALFTFIIPIAFAAFFGAIFSGGDAIRVSMGIAVEDTGVAGQQFVGAITSPEAQKMLNLKLGARDELLTALENGNVQVVLLLPADLTEKITAGKASEVEIYYDAARQNSAGIGLGMARILLAETNLNIQGMNPLLVPQIKSVQSNPIKPIDFYVPSTLAMAMLWLGLFGTMLPLVEQREQQVLRRLSICPVRRLNLLLGQVSWRLTVGITQAAAFALMGLTLLGLQFRGDWLLFALASILGALTFISMGYMLAGFSRTTEGAVALAQVVNFPLMFLSGIFFEAQVLPAFLRPVMNVMPPTYLADAFRQTIAGYPGLYPLWTDFAVLFVWLIVFIALGLKFFRWERN